MGVMHRTVTASIAAEPDRLAAIVSDLGTYPEWLELVTSADPTDEAQGDVGPAWLVTLRARVGPFARSKKLRMMQQTPAGSADPARFVRNETDGRDHSAWILEAQVSASSNSDGLTAVTMQLRYEGSLWSAPLDAVLGSQVDQAISGLRSYAQTVA